MTLLISGRLPDPAGRLVPGWVEVDGERTPIEPRIDALESSWFYPGFADRDLDQLTRARQQSLVEDHAVAEAQAHVVALMEVRRMGRAVRVAGRR